MCLQPGKFITVLLNSGTSLSAFRYVLIKVVATSHVTNSLQSYKCVIFGFCITILDRT